MPSFTADCYTSPHPSTYLYGHSSLGSLRQPNSCNGAQPFPTNSLYRQVPYTYCYSLYMDRLQDHLLTHCKSYSLSLLHSTNFPRRPSSLAPQLPYSHSSAFFTAGRG